LQPPTKKNVRIYVSHCRCLLISIYLSGYIRFDLDHYGLVPRSSQNRWTCQARNLFNCFLFTIIILLNKTSLSGWFVSEKVRNSGSYLSCVSTILILYPHSKTEGRMSTMYLVSFLYLFLDIRNNFQFPCRGTKNVGWSKNQINKYSLCLFK
jgi:hypothetical protein